MACWLPSELVPLGPWPLPSDLGGPWWKWSSSFPPFLKTLSLLLSCHCQQGLLAVLRLISRGGEGEGFLALQQAQFLPLLPHVKFS